MFLHSNIKFLRNYTHLTQADFGKLFNKTRSNVDSYERGNAKPDTDTQKKISEHFNISLEVLLYKDLQANPGLLLASGDGKGKTDGEVIKAKDELIKELRSQIRFLQQQNETLLNKINE